MGRCLCVCSTHVSIIIIKGNATDTAVLCFSEALSIPSLDIDTASLLSSHDKLFEIPFNSKDRWMPTVVRAHSTVAGSPAEN
ncbi:hypothetical protein SCP_1503100 [Sparassis crispa]|uniref:Uncharacterized protein n=1 Tax=Sparassis crispa TaxID=139825 RepID=A0A401H4G3_9APHY|nr:hypothetical protein SCP_1503100 [Sparassis crispa]GBE89302.1 hypothetical protein SCP_1503100 [Sparassis crispa]